MAKTRTNRIVFNMPAEKYRKNPCVSFSSLKTFIESPLDYYREVNGFAKRPQSAAMKLGTILHGRILEGKANYVVRPETYPPENKPWSGNAAWCRDWIEHQTLPVVSNDERSIVEGLALYACTHPRAVQFLEKTKKEVSMFAQIGGRQVKGRADIYANGILADLKTVEDASVEAFNRSLTQYKWHIQAALYTRLAHENGNDVSQFHFIVLEKSAFPKINVRPLSVEAMRQGNMELDDALCKLSQCEQYNRWPEWYDEIETGDDIDKPKVFTLPQWKINQTDDEVVVGGKLVTV